MNRMIKGCLWGCIIFVHTLVATEALPGGSSSNSNHILYLMHTGNINQALQAYQRYKTETGSHDFELLERMGLSLLDQGFRTRDPEIQAMALFGAHISQNEKALYIVEDALMSNNPELQIIGLKLVGHHQNDLVSKLLYRAMGSDFLLIRLEAAFELAEKKDPRAVAQIEALMAKVDEALWPIFPQLFALIDNNQANRSLRRLLSHSNELVRVASILSVAEHGHDNFIPMIRRLATHRELAQQEACAMALGVFKDEPSVGRLQALTDSPSPSVKLAALYALYKLGRTESRGKIESLARAGDLYAIAILGKIKESEGILLELVRSNQLQIRMNAALALLEHRNRLCLPSIVELLLEDMRDLAMVKTTSPGKSLQAWRIVPSAKQNLETTPEAHELSLHQREELLIKSVELEEEDFLNVADAILTKRQNDLVPTLVEVLKNHPTPQVIALLKKHQQKVGAPLVRNYCNLALFSLKEPGPYAANLRDWIEQKKDVDLIRFRPLLPFEERTGSGSRFDVTPEDSSRLLVEAFESFVAMQDDVGIDLLISVISNGNEKNKYALVGLLMRAIQ